ncbi:hypothetical protein SRHO_G00047300 [Serrasalmus rhombeus]
MEAGSMDTIEVPQDKIVKKGSIKKKIEKLRRWSTSSGGSFKRPPKEKTLSLRQPTETEEDSGEGERVRRKLRPMVASVFGQVEAKALAVPHCKRTCVWAHALVCVSGLKLHK